MDTYLELDKQSVLLSRENEFVLYCACGRACSSESPLSSAETATVMITMVDRGTFQGRAAARTRVS